MQLLPYIAYQNVTVGGASSLEKYCVLPISLPAGLSKCDNCGMYLYIIQEKVEC